MTKVVNKEGKYVVIDNGTELEGVTIIKDGDREVLKLPANSANRQYVEKKLVDTKTEVELKYKETRTLGPRTGSTGSTKKLIEYLTEEERKVIEDLMAKAKERMFAEKNDPKAQLKAKIEALQKKLAELNG